MPVLCQNPCGVLLEVSGFWGQDVLNRAPTGFLIAYSRKLVTRWLPSSSGNPGSTKNLLSFHLAPRIVCGRDIREGLFHPENRDISCAFCRIPWCSPISGIYPFVSPATLTFMFSFYHHAAGVQVRPVPPLHF